MRRITAPQALMNEFSAAGVSPDVGTDWPILATHDREKLKTSLTESGLGEEERRLVAEGNAWRLLGLRKENPVAK